jgi:hypothetical protein
MQDKLALSPEIAKTVQLHIDSLRTAISLSEWGRVPPPSGKVGQVHYWWRNDLKKWLQDWAGPPSARKRSG